MWREKSKGRVENDRFGLGSIVGGMKEEGENKRERKRGERGVQGAWTWTKANSEE